MPFVPEKIYDALQNLYFAAFSDGQARERNNAYNAINLAWCELDKLVVEREPNDEGQTLEEAEELLAELDKQGYPIVLEREGIYCPVCGEVMPVVHNHPSKTLTKQQLISLLGDMSETRG